MKEIKSKISLKPTYKITKIGELAFKIFNFERKTTYIVAKKPVLFKKSGKTYTIWTCTCPSYQKWGWRSHSCKHIDMLMDTGDIK